MVFNELLYAGYHVSVGKSDRYEIDVVNALDWFLSGL